MIGDVGCTTPTPRWRTSFAAGVHPKIVSERLGHATIAVTLDLYSHVTPAIDAEAAALVASKIFEHRRTGDSERRTPPSGNV